ncbi:hypothetical protein HYH03_015599 [Edaphochlamys debaryana]|uniref:Uncharacterized protein n=1 Tax=Edaphochlamys debaryana TaxID=47281 RepID=A0A835XLN2_9CHLO|nr:hypothetical protein HYH03_015599 [Edaphochlamys debaryana]|eukprot:KAG2485715.1 hypothetical protein HYH03_015599 [Edaphochlamys debaryana]
MAPSTGREADVVVITAEQLMASEHVKRRKLARLERLLRSFGPTVGGNGGTAPHASGGKASAAAAQINGNAAQRPPPPPSSGSALWQHFQQHQPYPQAGASGAGDHRLGSPTEPLDGPGAARAEPLAAVSQAAAGAPPSPSGPAALHMRAVAAARSRTTAPSPQPRSPAPPLAAGPGSRPRATAPQPQRSADGAGPGPSSLHLQAVQRALAAAAARQHQRAPSRASDVTATEAVAPAGGYAPSAPAQRALRPPRPWQAPAPAPDAEAAAALSAEALAAAAARTRGSTRVVRLKGGSGAWAARRRSLALAPPPFDPEPTDLAAAAAVLGALEPAAQELAPLDEGQAAGALGSSQAAGALAETVPKAVAQEEATVVPAAGLASGPVADAPLLGAAAAEAAVEAAAPAGVDARESVAAPAPLRAGITGDAEHSIAPGVGAAASVAAGVAPAAASQAGAGAVQGSAEAPVQTASGSAGLHAEDRAAQGTPASPAAETPVPAKGPTMAPPLAPSQAASAQASGPRLSQTTEGSLGPSAPLVRSQDELHALGLAPAPPASIDVPLWMPPAPAQTPGVALRPRPARKEPTEPEASTTSPMSAAVAPAPAPAAELAIKPPPAVKPLPLSAPPTAPPATLAAPRVPSGSRSSAFRGIFANALPPPPPLPLPLAVVRAATAAAGGSAAQSLPAFGSADQRRKAAAVAAGTMGSSRDLNVALFSAPSWVHVAQLVHRWAGLMNGVAVSTALKAMARCSEAKMLDPARPESSPLLDTLRHLCFQVEHHLPDMGPREISGVLWALAKLGFELPPHLAAALLDSFAEQLGRANNLDLSQVAWAMRELGLGDAAPRGLVEAMWGRLQVIVEADPSRSCARSFVVGLGAVSRMGLRLDSEELLAAERTLSRLAPLLSGQDLANVFAALARMAVGEPNRPNGTGANGSGGGGRGALLPQAETLRMLLAHIAPKVNSLRGDEAVSVLQALARLRFMAPAPLLDGLMRQVAAQRSGLPPFALALSLWSAGRLPGGRRPPPGWLDAMLETVDRRLPEFQPSCVCTALYGIACLRVSLHPDLAVSVLARAEDSIPHFSAQEVTNVAWSVAHLPPDCVPSPGSSFWAVLAERVGELGLGSFTPQGLTNLLWALAYLTTTRSAARKRLRLLMSSTGVRLPPPKPTAATAAFLSAAGGEDELRTALRRALPYMNEQEMCLSVWALQRLRINPGAEWLEQLGMRALPVLPRLKTPEITALVHALSLMTMIVVQPVPYTPAMELVSALEDEVVQNRLLHTRDPQAVAGLLSRVQHMKSLHARQHRIASTFARHELGKATAKRARAERHQLELAGRRARASAKAAAKAAAAALQAKWRGRRPASGAAGSGGGAVTTLASGGISGAGRGAGAPAGGEGGAQVQVQVGARPGALQAGAQLGGREPGAQGRRGHKRGGMRRSDGRGSSRGQSKATGAAAGQQTSV